MNGSAFFFKQFIMKYLSFFLVSALLWSCSSDDSDKSVEPVKIEITSSETEQPIATDGGTTTIQFTTNAPWTAQTDQTWCKIAPASGGAGSFTLTVTSEANTGYDERNASVTLKSGNQIQTVTIKQKQKDAILLTSSKVEMTADGGGFAIEMQSNVEFEYEISENAKTWISPQTKSNRSLSSSTLHFTAEENTELEKRQGSIIIRSGELSETVTIYQDGVTPSIVLTQNEYTVPAEGETIQVELKSNVSYEIQMPDNTWVTEVKSRAMSSYTHYFTIAKNEEYDTREATIIFKNTGNGLSESIKIVQMQKDAIVVAQNEYSVPQEGGTITIEVGTNVQFTTKTSVDWITQVQTRGLVTEKLKFKIGENNDDKAREGNITIENGELKQTIKVVQACKEENNPDRDILIAFFKAVGGENWTINTNWCSNQPLKTWAGVYTDENGRVKELYLGDSNMKGDADFRGLDCLTTISASEYAAFTSLNVSGCTKLRVLSFEENELTSIDVTNCSSLFQMEVDNNKLTTLDFTGCSSLRYLDVDGNKINIKDLSPIADQLTHLECSDCGLASLDLRMPNLNELSCGQNNLTSIDLSQYPKLVDLYCPDNLLSSLDFSNCPKFEELDCFNNQITSINFTGCTRLYSANCSNNQLSNLELTDLKEVVSINCSDNLLTSLSISNCPVLSGVSCSNNKLSSLSISNCPNIGGVSCYNNKLTALDFSDFPNIESIYCYDNELSVLNLSNCSMLKYVDCYNNKLEDLDLSSLEKLERLDCSNNLFTTLDVSSCSALQTFRYNSEGLKTLYLHTTIPNMHVSSWGEHNPDLYLEPSHLNGYQYPELIWK